MVDVSELIADESAQVWSQDALTEKRVDAITDPIARNHATTALRRRQLANGEITVE